MYAIKLTKQAMKDREKLRQAGLLAKAKNLVDLMKENPFQNPPPYEKLTGELKNYYSRRINRQHRLVYKVHEDKKIVAIHSMWSHYEF